MKDTSGLKKRGNPNWVKGQSANPGGKTKELAEIIDLARQASPEAIGKIVRLMRSEDERVAFAAAQEVINRGYGKPKQSIEADIHGLSLPALLAGILGGAEDAAEMETRPAGLRDRGVAGSA